MFFCAPTFLKNQLCRIMKNKRVDFYSSNLIQNQTFFQIFNEFNYFSKKKIRCVGYDVNKEKIKKINSGVIPLPDLKSWFGFDIKGLVKQNYLKATSNYKDLIKLTSFSGVWELKFNSRTH